MSCDVNLVLLNCHPQCIQLTERNNGRHPLNLFVFVLLFFFVCLFFLSRFVSFFFIVHSFPFPFSFLSFFFFFFFFLLCPCLCFYFQSSHPPHHLVTTNLTESLNSVSRFIYFVPIPLFAFPRIVFSVTEILLYI